MRSRLAAQADTAAPRVSRPAGAVVPAPALSNRAVSQAWSQGLNPAYPLEDPLTRAMAPGPRYWLTHEPDLVAMPPHRLDDEANQIDEWLARQTTSSRDDARLLDVRNALRAQALQRERLAARPAPRPKRARQGRSASAQATPAATAQGPGGDTRPRLLREQRSIGSANPAALAAEYDEIVTYLQREDIPRDERDLLQIELANLRPAMGAELAQRSNQRHAQAIGDALTPTAAWDVRSQLGGAARRIDSIQPLAGHPGYSVLMHGSEMLVMSDAQVAAVRQSFMQEMSRQTVGTRADTETVMQDWERWVKLNFEDQKYVGFFTILRSGENPSTWDELLLPHVAESNRRIGQFKALRTEAEDPWRGGPPAPLTPMAEAVGIATHQADIARSVLDYRMDKMTSAAGDIVSDLGRLKMAGQFAASIAFSPAGGALYGGVSSTAEQLSEMAHGQRDSLDPLAIGFDAAAGYVGAKVTRGVMGFGGKAAPLWQRGALFVLGDRAGASASVGTRMALDKATGRRDYSFSQIGSAMGEQATDAKQMLLNMVLARAGHFVQSRSRPVSAPKRQAANDEPRPTPDEPAVLKPAPDEPAAAPRTVADEAQPPAVASDPVELRLGALKVPRRQRKAFDKAATRVRQRARTDPDSAEELLQGLERRFGVPAPASRREQVADEFEAAQGRLYPEKAPGGKHRQSPESDRRAAQEQGRPSAKQALKASVRESERRGVAGGEQQAAREGIAVHDWDTPQKWKGEFGQGPDGLGTRGNKELVLEYKGGSSALSTSRRTGVVEMSNEWVGRKIAELEFVGDTATATRLLTAARENRLQGVVYRTRELKGGEKTSRLRSHQLRDRLGNEAISDSGLIDYAPGKVERAYLQRLQELRQAEAGGDVHRLP